MTRCNHQDINRFIGQRLGKVRADRELSQQELAAYLGTTKQELESYEMGKSYISAAMLKAAIKHLNISAALFFIGMEQYCSMPMASVSNSINVSI